VRACLMAAHYRASNVILSKRGGSDARWNGRIFAACTPEIRPEYGRSSAPAVAHQL